MVMPTLDASLIADWHAHVYFDADSRDDAWAFRDVLARQFGPRIRIGRFHERPVGPHPKWSYEVDFATVDFTEIVGWLALNHGQLDILVHPNTDDELRDHRDSAMWIGKSHALDVAWLASRGDAPTTSR
jgi:DOPA 4,5-dioxygenase